MLRTLFLPPVPMRVYRGSSLATFFRISCCSSGRSSFSYCSFSTLGRQNCRAEWHDTVKCWRWVRVALVNKAGSVLPLKCVCRAHTHCDCMCILHFLLVSVKKHFMPPHPTPSPQPPPLCPHPNPLPPHTQPTALEGCAGFVQIVFQYDQMNMTKSEWKTTR